ncbi:MAG: hypothetical protein RIT81_40570 [Deltaproteobacteria bacterium]
MSTHTETRSIYSHVKTQQRTTTRKARQARRHRARQRIAADAEAPGLRVERIRPIREMLRVYADADHVRACPLTGYLSVLEAEVKMLERWADSRTQDEQRAGPTIRRALELLRAFSRISVLDFSDIPDEDRPKLVALLALEHRWCYAAAGTSREHFKVATGRTGAR